MAEEKIVTPEDNLQNVLKLVDLINESISALKQELGGIKGRLTILEKKTKEETHVEAVKAEVTGVPTDIVAAVHNLLTDKVSIKVEDCKDRPAYMIHVTIPPEMSKSPVQPDIRSQVIKYADGVDGLKTWLQKVKNNIAQSYSAAGEAPPQY